MYKEKTFVCEYCGKEFNSEQECRKHEESHIESFCNLMREAARRLRKDE